MEIAVQQVELAQLGFSQFPTLALYHPRPTSGCSSCGHVVVCSTDLTRNARQFMVLSFPSTFDRYYELKTHDSTWYQDNY